MSQNLRHFSELWSNVCIRVDGVYLSELSAPWRKRHPARDLWTFLAILRGRLRTRQGGWSAEMGPGDRAIVPPDHPFSLDSLSVPTALVNIDFRVLSSLQGSNPLPLLGLPAVVQTEPTDKWEATCRQAAAFAGTRKQSLPTQLLGRGLCDQLITSCLFDGIESQAIPVSLRAPIPDWLATIRQRLTTMGTNREVTSMNRIAKESGYSRSRFFSEYSRVFGETPMATLWHLRLSVAAQRLDSDPAVAVGDIAQQCAFKSQSHFTQMFVRHFGMPPTQWRKRHLKPPTKTKRTDATIAP